MFCLANVVRDSGRAVVGRFRIFGISLPAPRAVALSATLYGHSNWRPLSRALPATLYGLFTQVTYQPAY